MDKPEKQEDGVTARKGRLSLISGKVDTRNTLTKEGMPEDELSGWMMMEFGIRERLAREYLTALLKGGVLLSEAHPVHGRVYWHRSSAPDRLLEKPLQEYVEDLNRTERPPEQEPL